MEFKFVLDFDILDDYHTTSIQMYHFNVSFLQISRRPWSKSVPKSTHLNKQVSPGITRIRKKTKTPTPKTVAIISIILLRIYFPNKNSSNTIRTWIHCSLIRNLNKNYHRRFDCKFWSFYTSRFVLKWWR